VGSPALGRPHRLRTCQNLLHRNHTELDRELEHIRYRNPTLRQIVNRLTLSRLRRIDRPQLTQRLNPRRRTRRRLSLLPQTTYNTIFWTLVGSHERRSTPFSFGGRGVASPVGNDAASSSCFLLRASAERRPAKRARVVSNEPPVAGRFGIRRSAHRGCQRLWASVRIGVAQCSSASQGFPTLFHEGQIRMVDPKTLRTPTAQVGGHHSRHARGFHERGLDETRACSSMRCSLISW
jgi:hypothetical protein